MEPKQKIGEKMTIMKNSTDEEISVVLLDRKKNIHENMSPEDTILIPSTVEKIVLK